MTINKRELTTFLLTIHLLTSARSHCPTECSCTENTILCVNKDIEKIPNFESLTVLPYIIDLSGNKINVIDSTDFDFKNNIDIKELYLNSTELIEIDEKAFSKLANLQEIYLGNNLLNAVPPNFIKDLDYMLLLDLSSNYFEDEMPMIISKSLEVLLIVNCQVTSVTQKALRHLPNLRLLSLDQNDIHYFDLKIIESKLNDNLLLRLSYNTWECNCKTIMLLNYLADNNYIESSEPYECIDNRNSIANRVKVFASDLIEIFCDTNMSSTTRRFIPVKNQSIESVDLKIASRTDEQQPVELHLDVENIKIEKSQNDTEIKLINNIYFDEKKNPDLYESELCKKYCLNNELSFILILLSILFICFLCLCCNNYRTIKKSNSVSKFI